MTFPIALLIVSMAVGVTWALFEWVKLVEVCLRWFRLFRSRRQDRQDRLARLNPRLLK